MDENAGTDERNYEAIRRYFVELTTYMSRWGAEAAELNYFDLAEIDGVERWARACPFCRGGCLLVTRNPVSLRIVEFDSCTLCGQQVRYKDVEAMRRKDGAK